MADIGQVMSGAWSEMMGVVVAVRDGAEMCLAMVTGGAESGEVSENVKRTDGSATGSEARAMREATAATVAVAVVAAEAAQQRGVEERRKKGEKASSKREKRRERVREAALAVDHLLADAVADSVTASCRPCVATLPNRRLELREKVAVDVREGCDGERGRGRRRGRGSGGGEKTKGSQGCWTAGWKSGDGSDRVSGSDEGRGSGGEVRWWAPWARRGAQRAEGQCGGSTLMP